MAKDALEFLRKEREKAWDEGFRAGFAYAVNGKQKRNPYHRRKEKPCDSRPSGHSPDSPLRSESTEL